MATTTRRKKTATGAGKTKAATAKVSKKQAKTDDGPSRAERVAAKNAELTERMLELREEGESWTAIGEALAITPGKAQFLMMLHRVAEGEVKAIKFKDDDDLAAKIAAEREKAYEFSSWGWISARTGVSEPKLKNLHAEINGWKPKTENIAIERAKKNGDTTTAKKGSKATTTKGKVSATKAARAKAKAKRSRNSDPS